MLRAPAGPWMNKDLSPDQRADLVGAEMTLDEKISLAHGPRGFRPPARSPTEAATWDPKMAFAYGELIGRELRDQLYNSSIAPCIC